MSMCKLEDLNIKEALLVFRTVNSLFCPKLNILLLAAIVFGSGEVYDVPKSS